MSSYKITSLTFRKSHVYYWLYIINNNIRRFSEGFLALEKTIEKLKLNFRSINKLCNKRLIIISIQNSVSEKIIIKTNTFFALLRINNFNFLCQNINFIISNVINVIKHAYLLCVSFWFIFYLLIFICY